MRAPRRPRTGRVLAGTLPAAALIVAAIIFAVVQVGASRGFDEALSAFSSARNTTDAGGTSLRAEADQSAAIATASSTILAADAGDALPADARDALASTGSALQKSVEQARAAVPDASPSAPRKPFWAWELGAGTDRLRSMRADAEEQGRSIETARTALDAATTAASGAGTAALSAAAGTASGIEQANISARTGDVIALRNAAKALSDRATALSQWSADAFTAYEAAIVKIRASNEAELAEKAGPLYDARLQVEAYARSIAGGVLLDFDWAPIVNGYGDNGSAGGLTDWSSGEGTDPEGYSTITLSNSVAEMWPNDVSRALVTHEVGHSISSKCWSMFDWQSRDANEAWATAWALSWGQTADGNGVSIYGYPPQSLIDTAATCR